MAEKWRAFGWWTVDVDGHNLRQIIDALKLADNIDGMSKCIITRTVKGKGMPQYEASHAHMIIVAETDYEKNINNFIDEGCDLILTVGFLMGDSTATAARANPDVSFAIVDFDYFPGFGCDESLSDCYEEDLANVTSLMFQEDEVGYLACV